MTVTTGWKKISVRLPEKKEVINTWNVLDNRGLTPRLLIRRTDTWETWVFWNFRWRLKCRTSICMTCIPHQQTRAALHERSTRNTFGSQDLFGSYWQWNENIPTIKNCLTNNELFAHFLIQIFTCLPIVQILFYLVSRIIIIKQSRRIA